MVKSIFVKGQIGDWESDYIHVMPHQFICENFNYSEIWNWCMDNLGGNMNWMVTMNGVILRNEDDAILFVLAWC